MEKFNAKIEVEKIIDFIKNYYKENNLGGAIIGISGGKDSAVVAGLMVSALGKENVIGVHFHVILKMKMQMTLS